MFKIHFTVYIYFIGAVITGALAVRYEAEDFHYEHPNLRGQLSASALACTAYMSGIAWPISLPCLLYSHHENMKWRAYEKNLR